MRVRWAMEYGSVGDGKLNAPKNHKLAQKPQARPKNTKTAKTTSSPKNHKFGQNHKLAQKPHHRTFAVFGFCADATLAISHAVRYAHGTRISLGLMPLCVAFCGFSRFVPAI